MTRTKSRPPHANPRGEASFSGRSRGSDGADPNPFPEAGTWVVYLLGCADGTLYAGVTNDLEHRLGMHNSGRGAKYTRGRLPVQVLYFEICEDHGAALRRERAIKRLPRRDKLLLFTNRRTLQDC